jgi:HNH endonuclease
MAKSLDVYPTLALRLHAYGLKCLHDPNWTGMTLYDEVKRHVRGRQQPTDLLFRTIENGILYHLGLWLYAEYMHCEYDFEKLEAEYKAWYLEDYADFLGFHRIVDVRGTRKRLRNHLRHISKLCNKSEDDYLDYIESDEGQEAIWENWEELQDVFSKDVDGLAHVYALDYANRVFHDRQLCEHVAAVIVTIGFDGNEDLSEEPRQWIKRHKIPAWARRAVHARDRGHCANCGINILFECLADDHIDHIIPLARGGCNDLVNLQLLCAPCNLKSEKR